MRSFVLISIFLLSVVSCYREVVFEEADADRFHLTVTPEKQKYIYESRDTSYTIEDPELSLAFNDQPLELKEIRVRGKSATWYQRKSYVVFLSDPIPVVDKYGSGGLL
ncbi:MAG: hypothetical protein ABFS28_01780 [Bacteroidota bacterium]